MENKDRDAQLLDLLYQLRDAVAMGHYASKGICRALEIISEQSGPQMDRRVLTDRLHALFQRWPEYSGSKVFPVKTPAGDGRGFSAHAIRGRMWSESSAYGRSRRRLLAFLIAELEQEPLRQRIAALEEFAHWVKDAPVESGVCACGDEMVNHGHGISDHAPVDEWERGLRGWLRSLDLEG